MTTDWMKLRTTLAAFLVATLSAITVNPAGAGDFASREIIGFNADSTLFAFEEYGVQDGSGFPYSNIYVIETATDSWLSGSPYRARIDDENATLVDARQASRKMAEDVLPAFVNPGTINATNQPLEVSPAPRKMEARPFHFVPPTDDTIAFEINQYPLAASGDLARVCEDFGGSKGFELVRTKPGPSRILHRDEVLPSSRGCPLDYRFADIVTHRLPSGEMTYAILVLYERVGFEGPDGRFLAITFRE